MNSRPEILPKAVLQI